MIRVLEARYRGLPVSTRMPFRYGIAVLTEVPHLFVELLVDVEGQRVRGLAADNLPPKWFVKDPGESFAQELEAMMAVISHACEVARELSPQASLFQLWRACYQAQSSWAQAQGHQALLWQFGLSLVERALIDAFCRAKEVSFAKALRHNLWGLELDFFYPSLRALQVSDFLPETPLRQLHVRHTVGLSDPLTEADILAEDRADDGLPQSLLATLDVYGISHLKVKLSGASKHDMARLQAIAAIVQRGHNKAVFSLDGNEQFSSFEAFKDFWLALLHSPSLQTFLAGLLFVEQPFARDIALDEALTAELLAWDERPVMIIDESDAELGSLGKALAAGYQGSSHKNCKGIFKSVANLGLLSQKRLEHPERSYVLSGEDLTNIGPVALQQDLAVLASLGISHAERNGHHYFKGLSMFSQELQATVLAQHGDLYHHHEDAVTLKIQQGEIQLGTVNEAAFGLGYELDVAQFAPIAEVLKPFQG